jgi:homocysteine S-methyltransferase
MFDIIMHRLDRVNRLCVDPLGHPRLRVPETRSMTTSAFGEFESRLACGGVVVVDGGMGTELQARGVRMDNEAWSAVANLSNEQAVREIHESFIRAGAELIITNTYAAARMPLEQAGLGDRVVEANRRAVNAAREARSRTATHSVAIAGSMSIAAATMDVTADRRARRGGAALRDDYREQAHALADAGVDLIVLEMMTSADHCLPALAAAAETGLPLVLGLSVLPPVGDRVPPLGQPDDDIEELLSASIDGRLAAVVVMHSVIDAVAPALRRISQHWTGPIGAYPHVGTFQPPNWIFGDLNADAFATDAGRWVGQGAQLVGGCCGIRPEHIRALADAVDPLRVSTDPPLATDGPDVSALG